MFPISVESVLKIIRQAGEEVLKIYDSLEDDWAVQLKEDRTPITEADRISNRIISEGLKELYPDFPILSEESQQIPYDARRKFEYFWLVDPLDGTKEFLKRNGEFTINLALIHFTRPIAGFISVPCQGLIYYAVKGQGAFKIQEKVSKERGGEETAEKGNEGKSQPMQNGLASKLQSTAFSPDEPGLIVVASRSHFDPETQKFINQLHNPQLVSVGSSLKFMLLAEGKAHLYPRLSRTMEWDTAAGQAILEEAGGQVLDFYSRHPLAYNKESLANPPFLATGRMLK